MPFTHDHRHQIWMNTWLLLAFTALMLTTVVVVTLLLQSCASVLMRSALG